MIVLSADSYREMMGDNWCPGMILEMARLFRSPYMPFFFEIKKDVPETSALQFVKDIGWNSEHVIVLHGPPRNVPDDVKEDVEAFASSNLEPAIAFLMPEIKDVRGFIELATKLSKLRAFL